MPLAAVRLGTLVRAPSSATAAVRQDGVDRLAYIVAKAVTLLPAHALVDTAQSTLANPLRLRPLLCQSQGMLDAAPSLDKPVRDPRLAHVVADMDTVALLPSTVEQDVKLATALALIPSALCTTWPSVRHEAQPVQITPCYRMLCAQSLLQAVRLFKLALSRPHLALSRQRFTTV